MHPQGLQNNLQSPEGSSPKVSSSGPSYQSSPSFMSQDRKTRRKQLRTLKNLEEKVLKKAKRSHV